MSRPLAHLRLLFLTLVGLGASAGATGCALPGTGGDLVEVGWRLESGMSADAPIRTADPQPWEVELTEARILIGPVYVYAPPTVASRVTNGLMSPRLLSPLAYALKPAVAHAHAGDDNADGLRVRAELLEQVSVDLVERSSFETLTPAEAGEVTAVNIVLDEPRFNLASEDAPTHGHHAWLRGVARRGDETIRFAAGLSATVPSDRIARRVEAVPVQGADDLSETTTLVVRADPAAWVRQMRFDRLEVPTDGGELVVTEPSQFHNAWYLGLRDPASWTVHIER